MEFIKKLVTGKLSLATTFFGGGVLGDIFCSLIALASFSFESTGLLIIAFILKWIISSMVLVGIFLILRNDKITIWGIIALVIALLNFLYSTIYFIGICMAFIQIISQ